MAGLTVPEKLGLEKGHHELKIGKSFDKSARDSFHTIRYDFKPASVDTNQESTLVVGDDGGVEVTVPHVQSSGTSHTVYKGNKRALQKECALIINHDTGEITLEKLSYAIHLKKTRADPSVRMIINPRPLTPIDKSKASPVAKAPVKPQPSISANSSAPSSLKPPTHLTSSADIFAADLGTDDMAMSSSSSSDSSSASGSGDSDSDEEKGAQAIASQPGNSQDEGREETHPKETHPKETHPKVTHPKETHPKETHPKESHTTRHTAFLHTLSQDLRLSESSDDDSD